MKYNRTIVTITVNFEVYSNLIAAAINPHFQAIRDKTPPSSLHGLPDKPIDSQMLWEFQEFVYFIGDVINDQPELKVLSLDSSSWSNSTSKYILTCIVDSEGKSINFGVEFRVTNHVQDLPKFMTNKHRKAARTKIRDASGSSDRPEEGKSYALKDILVNGDRFKSYEEAFVGIVNSLSEGIKEIGGPEIKFNLDEYLH